ncbi:hypothetical protein ABW20_dc0107909 [Dactylellina cionopaga]|nr:hypothetical protein ABW20_dc0107909 [Dactylellina cionopaga]
MRFSSTLPVFLLLAGLSTNVLAQNNNNNNGGSNSVSNRPGASNTQNDNPPASTNPPASQSQSQDGPPPKQSSDTPSSSSKDDNKSSSQKVDPPPAKTTDPALDAPSLSSTTSTPNVVSATSGSQASSNPDDPPPPKYTPPDNSRYKVPDYPPPSVPNTKNAPYMQKSNLPEGTVFIAVGAALGLIGLIAFAWRMVVAYQLRRSIRKANMAAVDSKAGLLGRYNAPTGTKKSFYSAGAGSSLSLDHLGSSRTGLGPTPNASLFFSPTASNSPAHQNRGSQYLPAGYYAPAASTNLPFNQSRDSLPRPRPATRDSHIGTPPASPLLIPQPRRSSPGHGHAQAPSISSTLGVQPGGRTPSTYLEDMLDVPFPAEDPALTTEQARRASRRKSGHSYGGSGSRR